MIVVGSCYFLLTLVGPDHQNIDFCFPLINIYNDKDLFAAFDTIDYDIIITCLTMW